MKPQYSFLINKTELVPVSPQLRDLVTIFEQVETIEGKADQIAVDDFDRTAITRMMEIPEKLNYSFKEVTKVKNSNAAEYIGPELTKIFDEMDSKMLVM